MSDVEKYKRVTELWQEIVDAGQSEDFSDEVFMAVNYAELASRGDARLTSTGEAKVDHALRVLSKSVEEQA
jgi:hypothetical protein